LVGFFENPVRGEGGFMVKIIRATLERFILATLLNRKTAVPAYPSVT